RARAISGLSMGGFGALSLAMRHPDIFASVASHSGVVPLLYAGPHPYAPGQAQMIDAPSDFGRGNEVLGLQGRKVFGPDIANWREHDPALQAGKLRGGTLAIYFDCGTEDEYGFQDGAAYLHDLLAELGIGHTFVLVPGRHDWAFWTQRIGQ